MNDLPLFIAIVIVSALLVLTLLINIIFKVVSIIKERKNVEEKIDERIRSDEVQISGNDDNNNTGRLSETKQILNESIEKVKEDSEMDEKRE